MANAAFTPLKAGLLDAAYDFNTAVLKVALVRGYTFNAAHATMNDITTSGGVINGVSAALTNVTITGGVVDADDTTIATTANASNHVLILYQASAVTGGADVASSSQKLIAYFDTGTGLPVVPGTGTLTITWPNTANRIMKIG
jgi:hypothetical protein